MLRTPNSTRTSDDPSIPFSIMDLTNQSLRLPGISKGAQILLCELLKWSGEKGYCWWSVPKIAKDLNWSVSVVWRKSKDLQKAGLLEVIPRPGRSNYWVPLPGPAKMQRVINETTPLAESRVPLLKENRKLKRTVEKDYHSTNPLPPSSDPNVNAVEISSSLQMTMPLPIQPQFIPDQADTSIYQSKSLPPSTPTSSINEDPDYLVEEMERVTNDTHSKSAFRQIACRVPEQTVFQALSATRIAMSQSSLYKPGGYFIGVIRSLCPEFQFTRSGKFRPSGPSGEERLSQLQSRYPCLRVEALFDRYIEVKRDTTGLDKPADSSYWLLPYENFLAIHHSEIYAQKPQYRREVDA